MLGTAPPIATLLETVRLYPWVPATTVFTYSIKSPWVEASHPVLELTVTFAPSVAFVDNFTSREPVLTILESSTHKSKLPAEISKDKVGRTWAVTVRFKLPVTLAPE